MYEFDDVKRKNRYFTQRAEDVRGDIIAHPRRAGTGAPGLGRSHRTAETWEEAIEMGCTRRQHVTNGMAFERPSEPDVEATELSGSYERGRVGRIAYSYVRNRLVKGYLVLRRYRDEEAQNNH